MTAAAKQDNYLKNVRNQYEDYPYPRRDPEEEKTRLLSTCGDGLDFLNHYCFSGKRNLHQNTRFLIAGCGTGDAVVYYAEQLRGGNGEIVALDFSEASLEVAKERCRIRGLEGIRFIHAPIQDIPKLKLGTFDIINCSGVLHHLKSPEEGLAILVDSLAEDGAMNMMVYGKYGRFPIYLLQDALKMVAGPELDVKERIRRAYEVIDTMPQESFFQRSRESYVHELLRNGEIGVYDMYLHSQDRAYTVPELYDWLEGAGLKLVEFTHGLAIGKLLYNPLTFVADAAVRADIERMSKRDQQTLAELLRSNLGKHSFFAMKNPAPLPSPEDESMVPFVPGVFYSDNICETISQRMKENPGKTLPIGHSNVPSAMLNFNPPSHAPLLFKYLDGSRTIGEIITLSLNDAKAAGEDMKKVTRKSLLAEFAEVFNAFHMMEWMLLRAEGVPSIPSSTQMQQRMVALMGHYKQKEPS